MHTQYQAIRGTYDILPDQSARWQRIEREARAVFGCFHFREIRTPVFEATDLFARSIGQTTDIVSKEMYTFPDKKGRSITLRPEATVCVVRAMIEHSEMFQHLPQKLYYMGPMFRYEKPQSGRNRQFHQIGVEAIGSYRPGMDAEVIALVCHLLQSLGVNDVRTEINSVGCPECRPAYGEKLKAHLAERAAELCDDCRVRLEKNPLRVFDCKNPHCAEMVREAPALPDEVCAACAEHFKKLCTCLDAARVAYQINKRLVRGIDYYTKTTFELRHSALGAQDAIAAGGRYDNLVAALGGPATGAVGFALGVERVAMAMQADGGAVVAAEEVDAFVVSPGPEAYLANTALCLDLRRRGFHVEIDHEGKSVKAQMRQADKLRARFVLIRGEKEWKNGSVQVKRMADGNEQTMPESQVQETLEKS